MAFFFATIFSVSGIFTASACGGLVSHWSLDGTALDSQGINDAVLGPIGLNVGQGSWNYTAPNWTSGKLGLGLDFSGATYPGPGDAVMVPNSPSLNSSSFTVSTWINTLQTDNYVGYITKGWGSNIGDNGGWMLDSNSGLRATMQSDGGVSPATSPPGPNVADGQWHSAVMTYDGTTQTLNLYMDGSLAKTTAADYGLTSKDIMFGGDGYANILLDGKLDDIGYWDHVLAAPEVKAVTTMANHADLAYSLDKAESIFTVFRNYAGSRLVDGRTWSATGGLTGGLGEVVKTGDYYSVRLDERGNGATTGAPSPTNPPDPPVTTYTPIANPGAILNDWPTNSQVDWTQYIEPITAGEFNRFKGPALVNDPEGDMSVRAWNYMPNVPEQGGAGIVESVNIIDSRKTAVILVHPWGIEDGQGWEGPQAYNLYGYAFEGLLEDNLLGLKHIDDNVKPFVDSMRGEVELVGYSLPGSPDATRNKIYRDYDSEPTEAQRAEGQAEIEAYLNGLTGTQWPDKIPVSLNLEHDPDDFVLYDGLGYTALRNFLLTHGIENILLGGYATDMCVISTNSGYQNLTQDFNVFLVGDATLAAWPTTSNPPNGYNPHPTRDELITASQYDGAHPMAITQSSWILTEFTPGDANRDGRVDEADASILAGNWLTQTEATWAMGDFNDDGAVDGLDATLLAANWQSSSSATVPEPATIALLTSILPFICAALSVRRKRK